MGDSEEELEDFDDELEVEDSIEIPEVNTTEENNPPLLSVKGSCTDNDAKCTIWAGYGYCKPSHYYSFHVRPRCKKACQLCGTGTNSPCGGEKLNLNPVDILKHHNDWRSKVALGQFWGVQASNMRKFTWDTTLANQAQQWAFKCPKKGNSHSPESETDVGENVYGYRTSGDITKKDLNKRAVDSWAKERFNIIGTQDLLPY